MTRSPSSGRGPRNKATKSQRRTGFRLCNGLQAFLSLGEGGLQLQLAVLQFLDDVPPALLEGEDVVLELVDPALLDLMCAGPLDSGSELRVYL